MRTFFSFICFLLYFTSLYAQTTAPAIEWQKCFGGNNDDRAYSIEQTSDGGFIIAGYTFSNDGDVTGNHSANNSDYWIVKINSKGIIQWQKCLGGTRDDAAYSIRQTDDGGFIVAGYTESNNGDVNGNYAIYLQDYWIAKLNAEGVLQWQKCLGGSMNDWAYSIRQTRDSGYIVAGYTISSDGDASGIHGISDYWIVKLNAEGDIQWQKCYGGSKVDYAFSVRQTNDDGFIIAGLTMSNDGDVNGNHSDSTNSDSWIIKLNSSGNIQWQKCLGGSQYEMASSIEETNDFGYIISGETTSNNGDVVGNHGKSDSWIVKSNAAGDIQWQKCLGGSKEESSMAIEQTNDSGYVVAGYTYSNDEDVISKHGSTDSSDIWIVKLNAGGDIQWQKCLGGSKNEFANSIKQTKDGGYIIAGFTRSVDGDVSGNHGDYDFWVVKLSSANAVDEYSADFPEKKFISILPNPSSNTITIRTKGMSSVNNLIIYNVYGQQVYSTEINKNETIIDLSEYSPGAYTAVAGTDRQMFVVGK